MITAYFTQLYPKFTLILPHAAIFSQVCLQPCYQKFLDKQITKIGFIPGDLLSKLTCPLHLSGHSSGTPQPEPMKRIDDHVKDGGLREV